MRGPTKLQIRTWENLPGFDDVHAKPSISFDEMLDAYETAKKAGTLTKQLQGWAGAQRFKLRHGGRLTQGNADRNQALPASTIERFKKVVGEGTFNRAFEPFATARKYVRGLKLKTKDEYIACWAKLKTHRNIPRAPQGTYKNEWIDWADWLGKKPAKTPIEEHIKTAQKLARKNRGILPSVTWLKKHGFDSINQCMFKYPKRFKHVQQERLHAKRNTVTEHVEQWKAIVKKQGRAPIPYWLRKNGFNGMYECMRLHPEAFNLTT